MSLYYLTIVLLSALIIALIVLSVNELFERGAK